MQNGKIRVFLHNNSHNQKFRRTTYPYSWTTSPSPELLPFPPTHWLSSFYQSGSQGTIDPSLVLLDKFTKISLDAYWQEIVNECRNNSLDELERNAEPNIY